MKRLTTVLLALGCSTAMAQNVLVFDQNTEDQVAQTACNNLGLSCTVAGSTDFVTQLTGGTWDLVIMDLPSNTPDGDWQGELSTYIADGGRAIQTGWDNTDFSSLAADFEVTLEGDHDAIPFYQWNSSELFSNPNPVPSTMNVIDDSWGTNGFYLSITPAGTGVAAAGFVPTPTADEAAIVIGNSGRTIFNGLLFDDFFPGDADSSGKDDIVELVENQIGSVLGADSDTLLINVTKTFSNGDTGDVDVTLTCNGGIPLQQDFTISGGGPGVTFTVTNLPEAGVNCEVTESGGNDGYMTVMNGGAGCSWNGITGGRRTCAIENVPEATAVFVYTTVEGEADPSIDTSFTTTIICQNVSPDTGPNFGTVTVTDTSGAFTADWYADPVNGTDCTVEMVPNDMAVEGDSCAFSFEIGDATAGCDVEGTVFFEGIPTLSQYGLAILALLMLGIGFVGMRRFV